VRGVCQLCVGAVLRGPFEGLQRVILALLHSLLHRLYRSVVLGD
jgi:hypothetical protein